MFQWRFGWNVILTNSLLKRQLLVKYRKSPETGGNMSKKVTLTNTKALALQMAQVCAVRAYSELENRLFMHAEYDPMDFVRPDGCGEKIIDMSMTLYPQDFSGSGITIDATCTLNYEYGKFTRAEVVLKRWSYSDMKLEHKKFACTVEGGELRVVDCNAEVKKTEEVPVSRGFWRSLFARLFTGKAQ